MAQEFDQTAVIILAGGKGTRLNAGNPSPVPKVLYEIAGRPMIFYALDNLTALGIPTTSTTLVIGYLAEVVEKAVGDEYKYALQDSPMGTGHALACGLKEISSDVTTILVMNGDDSAFYSTPTLKAILKEHLTIQPNITFVTLERDDPTGLGRIIRDKNGALVKITEERDVTVDERKIKEVNDGLYIFQRDWLDKNIDLLRPNSNGEFYLTDLIAIALGQGGKVNTYKLGNPAEWHGINNLTELEQANERMKLS